MPAPKYVRIAALLKERIQSGEWPTGEKLPRMVDLAAEYKVSRNVVGAAVKALEAEGLLWAVPRKGTVVQVPGARIRIRRGNVVVRDGLGVVEGMEVRAGSYSFPSSAHGQRWIVHGTPTRGF
ncbi:winged helix-turn-helix domain-containing protein [Actinocorallia sp. B10E7]|uniref:winged helix-turn-helix domain-containing protein n=1 Tax=Actinocorallia sp. B10E7 TaxID=3153558 RepID=UPI00325F8FF2